MSKDYYAALEIDKEATADQIKKSYRKLALKFHPDKNQGDKKAEDRFKEITEAYAVLSDPEKKVQYDSYGDANFHQRFSQDDIFRNFDFGSIFQEFDIGADLYGQLFGSRGGRGVPNSRASFPSKGPDYSLKVRIPLRQAVLGGDRRVNVKTERGEEQLNIKIPAGTENKQKLRIAKKGGVSGSGGPPGDLFLEITIEKDSRFTRQGNDLYTDISIPFSGACLGTSVDVPTLDENKRVKVKAGIQHGDKIRLKGFGVPDKGDLYAVVNVEVPKKLTDSQQKLLEQLQEEDL